MYCLLLFQARNWEAKHFRYGPRFPTVETYVKGTGIGSYCYLEKTRPSSHSAVYLEKIRQSKIELEVLIERRIQRLGDSDCNVVLNNDGKGNCSLMQVQTSDNPLEGTSQPGSNLEDLSLAAQQVVRSSVVANTFPSPVGLPVIHQVHLQPRAKKPKMTAKERADKAHLRDLLSFQTKMGGPSAGLKAGLSLAMGRKPTQKEKLAAALQGQITAAMKNQVVQGAARSALLNAPKPSVPIPKPPVSILS